MQANLISPGESGGGADPLYSCIFTGYLPTVPGYCYNGVLPAYPPALCIVGYR